MENTNKWTPKDVITTVLFTVLLIVIQLGINMICMVNNFLSMVLSVGISCLVCAPVYFLMVTKVKKRFVSLIYMTVLGLVFLLIGDWFLLPWFILIGVFCEMILLKQGSYENPKKVTAAWLTYSALYIGVNLLPLWFFWETFETNAIQMGMSKEYIDSYISYYSNPAWVIGILFITVALGFVGSLIGKKMMNKHFKKAGLL
jgi:energy-coupling factor transport system substrate-specific component